MELKEWLGEDNQIGIDIWKNKYQYNNETLDEWFKRVSGGDEELEELIRQKKFLFGGRALANRGTNKKGSMFNCYSSGYAPDDVDGLMELNKNLALTYKAQGGQGVSLSKVRPKGTSIGKEFKSDGIVPFMEIFNTTTSSISQGGARKGALMISLDIFHKEAETFIDIKSNNDKITKANLSLEIDDTFMNAVKEFYDTGEVIILHRKENYNGHIVEYDVIPINLYKKMIKRAYDWGEPGCIFTNKFRNYNLMEYDKDYEIATCNPCGEQPLPANFSCNLGSLNLSEFVTNPYTNEAKFNFVPFGAAIQTAVRALDSIIDENLDKHALEAQSENSKNYRNIGLGIMGYANTLFKLGLKYGSDKALDFTNELFEFLQNVAIIFSINLAIEKGAFPKCKPSEIAEASILKNAEKEIKELISEVGIRNCSILSIAPTGSIATMLGISGGCEPEFALSYTRKTDNLNESYEMYCQSVKEYWETTNCKDKNINSLPDYFITSKDLSWKKRIDTQAIMQKYVDTAISSTINLPKETTLEEIEQLYLYAWKKGLKGITIYRDGCARGGILTTEDSNKKEEKEIPPVKIVFEKGESPMRGQIIKPNEKDCIGFKRKLMTGCGSLHCAVYFDINTGDLTEIYLSKGSTGGCHNFMVGLSRMISASARAGVSVADIVDQLMSTGACSSYVARTKTKGDTSQGSCCPMAVGYAIKEMWEEFNGISMKKPIVQAKMPVHKEPVKVKCPDCGGELHFEGGCNICRSCGWSKCD